MLVILSRGRNNGSLYYGKGTDFGNFVYGAMCPEGSVMDWSQFFSSLLVLSLSLFSLKRSLVSGIFSRRFFVLLVRHFVCANSLHSLPPDRLTTAVATEVLRLSSVLHSPPPGWSPQKFYGHECSTR